MISQRKRVNWPVGVFPKGRELRSPNSEKNRVQALPARQILSQNSCWETRGREGQGRFKKLKELKQLKLHQRFGISSWGCDGFQWKGTGPTGTRASRGHPGYNVQKKTSGVNAVRHWEFPTTTTSGPTGEVGEGKVEIKKGTR